MKIIYEIITDINKKGLDNEWNELVNMMKNREIFYCYEWAKCFMEYYPINKYKDVCIVLGKTFNNDIICLFPFTYSEKTINFITSESTDYNSYYVIDSINIYSVVQEAMSFLLKKYNIDKFCLTNMPSKKELFILQDVLRKMDFSVFLEESVVVPFLETAQKDIKGRRSDMKELARRERKMLREHETRYEQKKILSNSTFEFIIKNRNKRYPNSSFIKQEIVEFYRQLNVIMGDKIMVNELYIDNSLAAAHFGFKDDKKIYYYIPTFDEKFSRYALGNLLIKRIIDDNNGLIFDFLKGNEDYKFVWTDEVIMNFHLLAYKKNSGGTLPAIMIKLKNDRIIRKIFGR